jgi:hypothetical protein
MWKQSENWYKSQVRMDMSTSRYRETCIAPFYRNDLVAKDTGEQGRASIQKYNRHYMQRESGMYVKGDTPREQGARGWTGERERQGTRNAGYGKCLEGDVRPVGLVGHRSCGYARPSGSTVRYSLFSFVVTGESKFSHHEKGAYYCLRLAATNERTQHLASVNE